MAAAARIEALKGHGAMLVFAALISGSFSLGHRAAPHIDPALLNALRFALGALLLAPFALPHVRRENLRAPWRYLVLGTIFGLYFVLMFVALGRGEPVALAAVFTLTPLMSAGLGRLLLGQPATPRILLSLLVAACGALWVIFRGEPARLLALDLGAGELVYLAACFLHALYTPLVRRLNRGEPVRVFTFGMMAAGTLVLALLAAPAALATEWAAIPGTVWIALAYLVVFATTGTFLIVQYATLRLPASKVMAYGYLVSGAELRHPLAGALGLRLGRGEGAAGGASHRGWSPGAARPGYGRGRGRAFSLASLRLSENPAGGRAGRARAPRAVNSR